MSMLPDHACRRARRAQAWIAFAGGLMVAGLAGCSSDGQVQTFTRSVAYRAVDTLPGVSLPPASPVARYQALKQAGRPTMQMTMQTPSGTTRSTLRLMVTSADGALNWLAPDGSGYVFENGFLVATRGTPRDLMAADLLELQQAIGSQSEGLVTRFETRLAANGETHRGSYVCEVSFGTTASGVPSVSEVCSGLERDFTNTYHIDPTTGSIKETRQQLGQNLAVTFTR